GHLAAATSTGGMTNKRWGRIGDSPVIGAGTWADESCALSATGWGEFYIRNAVAHEVCARVRLPGAPPADAARAVVNRQVPALAGAGGATARDAQGNLAIPFNTPGMYRACIATDGSRGVALYDDE